MTIVQSRLTALSAWGDSHHLGIIYYVIFLSRLDSNEFQLKWRFGTHGNWKNQNPGGRFNFLISMGAKYLFEVKNNEIWVPVFFKHNNSSVATGDCWSHRVV